MTARHSLAMVALGGALEGTNVSFHWHVIPAGLAHGSLLAIAAMGCALFARTRDGAWRWGAVPFVGWFGGCASSIPLERSSFGIPIVEALAWPVVRCEDSTLALPWAPFFYFG